MTPLQLAFGQTRMFQTKNRTLDAGSSPWFHLRSGDSFTFQPGDGFTGRGWEAGTTLLMAGAVDLNQASKCVDVCAVKHHG